VVAEWKSIDVWMNCAMVTVFSLAHEMSAEEYRRVTEVTYLGYVHSTLSALARMRKKNSGTIIQIGSALAYRAIPLNRRTAPRNLQFAALPIRCAVNSFAKKAEFEFRWCSFPRLTRRSSAGREMSCRRCRSLCRLSFSLKRPHAQFFTRRKTLL
jgi:NAD(P)-dependent dehydrogenase (short-subunit alcohol dehydrogenase family)